MYFKNTVNEGESYIVNLNSDTKDAYIYLLSSKNSVYSIENKNDIINTWEKIR